MEVPFFFAKVGHAKSLIYNDLDMHNGDWMDAFMHSWMELYTPNTKFGGQKRWGLWIKEKLSTGQMRIIRIYPTYPQLIHLVDNGV